VGPMLQRVSLVLGVTLADLDGPEGAGCLGLRGVFR